MAEYDKSARTKPPVRFTAIDILGNFRIAFHSSLVSARFTDVTEVYGLCHIVFCAAPKCSTRSPRLLLCFPRPALPCGEEQRHEGRQNQQRGDQKQNICGKIMGLAMNGDTIQGMRTKKTMRKPSNCPLDSTGKSCFIQTEVTCMNMI